MLVKANQIAPLILYTKEQTQVIQIHNPRSPPFTKASYKQSKVETCLRARDEKFMIGLF